MLKKTLIILIAPAFCFNATPTGQDTRYLQASPGLEASGCAFVSLSFNQRVNKLAKLTMCAWLKMLC